MNILHMTTEQLDAIEQAQDAEFDRLYDVAEDTYFINSQSRPQNTPPAGYLNDIIPF